MLIDEAIKELEKEKSRGADEIFIARGDFLYDFAFGIDRDGEPVLSMLKYPKGNKVSEELADKRLKEEALGITDSWRD